MKRWVPGLLLFLAALVVYSANLRVVGAGDCWAIRYVPVSLLREGNLDLNEFPEIQFQVWDWTRDRLFRVPLQPVLAGIFAFPVYALADQAGVPFTPINIAYLGKLAATIYTALSAVILLGALRILLPRRRALLFAGAYAFGTCVWTVSSQDLWQHGLSHLLVAAGLYCLIAAPTRPRLAGISGIFWGLAAVTRGMNIPISGMILIYLLLRHRDQVWRFLLWCLPGAIYFFSYNLYYLGTPFNSIVNYALGFFNPAGIPGGLLGLLFSPARGLFIFSPFFLLVLVGIPLGWRKASPWQLLYRVLSLVVIFYLLFLSAWYMWWGGHCYGYRMLVDLAPILIILMVPGSGLLDRRPFRAAFYILLAISVLLQASGALYYSDRWNGRRKIDQHPERLWWFSGGEVDYMLTRAAGRNWSVERRVQLPKAHRAAPDQVVPGAR